MSRVSKWAVRANPQVQCTNRGLAVPQTSNLPGSVHEPRACGTSNERTPRFRARFAALRYLKRAISQVQCTNRGLAVPQTSNLPGSVHEPRACGTSNERSLWFRTRTVALRYLKRAISQVQGTIRGLRYLRCSNFLESLPVYMKIPGIKVVLDHRVIRDAQSLPEKK
ncbi:hypothetical protein [Ammoniphilus sp. YIM 78166]|uniref:hypothetical protein n=1 Tax=Ammoniphilus sp. YIM 78166 TaxID=1644106 RepID=UPI0014317DD3|nr:hypothetical protein [Ammoniphilus sp. YIM 78166]